MTNTDIKEFLKRYPRNQQIYLATIQNDIINSGLLQSDDKQPHTDTRTTNYPRWMHRLQSVLSELKSKNQSNNDIDANGDVYYTFL